MFCMKVKNEIKTMAIMLEYVYIHYIALYKQPFWYENKNIFHRCNIILMVYVIANPMLNMYYVDL